MVNAPLTNADDEAGRLRAARAAEHALALSYAPASRRQALAALFDLDAALGEVLRGASEPMLVQMRYTWWHDSLTRLDTAPAPAMPVLQAVASCVLPRGVSGADLATLVDGWEQLVEGDPADRAVRLAFAEQRGGVLFALGARVLDGSMPVLAQAGQGWALADLSRGLRDPVASQSARTEARVMLGDALGNRWPRALRALGGLAHLAAMDLAGDPARPQATTPRRVARLGWHRLTGW